MKQAEPSDLDLRANIGHHRSTQGESLWTFFIWQAAVVLVSVTVMSMTGCKDQKSASPINVEDSNPRLFQERQIGGREFGLQGSKKVALTFDDGPHPVFTPDVLDTLAQHGIRATFFITGANVRGNEAVMERMAREGHVIASHAYRHCGLAPRAGDRATTPRDNGDQREISCPAAGDQRRIVDMIRINHEILAPYLNSRSRLYFRAPYGAWRASNASLLNQHSQLRDYIGPIFWTAGGELKLDERGRVMKSADWACWGQGLSIEACGEGYLREIERAGGGVVLMHDWARGAEISLTPEMIKLLIPELKHRGYTFITLDQVPSIERFQDQLILRASQ